MPSRKVVPPSVDEYEHRRVSMLLRYAPRTYPCKKCGWPVIDGYCCNTCGDSAPYEAAPNAGVAPSDQRQRFEAWANDQGFPMRKLETSDDYLDLRTQGAWDAWQACAADGVALPDGLNSKGGQ